MTISTTDIQRIRAHHGWTQAQLALFIGTDAVTVSRWERGVSRPRPVAQRQLAALLVDSGPKSRARFVEDPTVRMRKVEAALRDQIWFKANVRLGI